MLVVLGLGFASGLPLLLVGSTLGAWLTDSGLSKASIGTFALVALPYSFNFLWAPFLDRLRLPYLSRRLGRRRSWMLVLQLCLIAAIAALSRFNPALEPATIAWLTVLVAWLSASQDVVIDAFRAEYLREEQYGEGAAMAVFGYRLGMLMAGAGALALADSINWNLAFLVMAALMLVGVITTLCTSEPPHLAAPTPSASPHDKGLKKELRLSIVEPFHDFAKRHQNWFWILLLIFTYRLPDGFIGFMTTPFFLESGFSKMQVASIAKLYGFMATLAGMFIGGTMIRRLGVQRCLFYFLLVQAGSNLAYLWLSISVPTVMNLAIAISIDNAAGGMVTAAAVAYMMTLCNKAYTATQYALLSSLASLASKTLASAAGWMAGAYGWPLMFGFSSLLVLPALLILLSKAISPQAEGSSK